MYGCKTSNGNKWETSRLSIPASLDLSSCASIICSDVNQRSLRCFTTQAQRKDKSNQMALAFRGVASQNSIAIAKTPIP